MYTKNSILHHVLIHVGEETSLSFELMDTKGRSAICDLDVIVILLYIIFGMYYIILLIR